MSGAKPISLHVAVIVLLFALNFLLPEYHHGVLARVMVFAVFAMGYALLFGYAGLLSLGHSMFFAAGMYGAALPVLHLGWSAPLAFVAGIAAGTALSLLIALLALRTTGVAFMIVTMMFAQVFYLAIIYFSPWTRGDEGFALDRQARIVDLGGYLVDLTNPTARYMIALLLFTIALFTMLRVVTSPFGRVLVAIRENEERTRMLGYNTFANKLVAVVVSGTVCAAAGAAYALLFGFAGAGFASVQYSILPLLWSLLGGAATTLGPALGALFMYYLVDITSGYTSAYLLFVGILLMLLVLFFPKGILGTARDRWARWLP